MTSPDPDHRPPTPDPRSRRRKTILFASAGAIGLAVVCAVTLWLNGHKPAAATASAGGAGNPVVAQATAVQQDAALLSSGKELAVDVIRQQLNDSATSAGVSVPGPVAKPVSQPGIKNGSASSAGETAVGVAPKVVAAGPAASQPEPQAVRTEASRFTLGGVIRIGGEAMATINGKLVHEGETIDGGKVVRIDAQTVEMESNGEQFTLRM